MKLLYLIILICIVSIGWYAVVVFGYRSMSGSKPIPDLNQDRSISGNISGRFSDYENFPDISELSEVISLESVFSSRSAYLKHIPDTITLLATGDVIPARTANAQALRNGDIYWPWVHIGDTIRQADLALINLETPLLDNCPVTDSGMSFCGTSRHTDSLRKAGVDIVSGANNHFGNWGIDGIAETVMHLKNVGIPVAGVGDPIVREVAGVKFVFTAFNDIGIEPNPIRPATEKQVSEDIRAADRVGDIVIASFHWGEEYVRMPTERQRKLAHLAIDKGADLVIGNHPHWIQPMELYKDKVIVYAHGNCIFDQMWSQETTVGILGEYIFRNKKLVDIRFHPLKILDYGQPYLLDGDQRQQVLDMMYGASVELKQFR